MAATSTTAQPREREESPARPALRGVTISSSVLVWWEGRKEGYLESFAFRKREKMASRSRKVVDDDLANVEFETSEDVEVIPTFDSMGLREDLLRWVLS